MTGKVPVTFQGFPGVVGTLIDGNVVGLGLENSSFQI